MFLFILLNRPGWLLRYIVGPHTPELFESFTSDVWAGITVALTLIPQGLSYATLANLPAINGLYAAILPSAAYTFFGSSMQLAVGPVAIVSLLTGTIVTKYVTNPTTHVEDAVDTAAQASLTCGIILVVMAVLNMGDFIHFLAHPVMSGFTSAAACLIGMNQLKSAFGFVNYVPQTGQPHFDHNYEVMAWWHEHFNDKWDLSQVKASKKTSSQKQQDGRLLRNPYAVKVQYAIIIK